MADEFVRVKLGADAKTWLEDCANREGLEPGTFLRRMVYVAMNGGPTLNAVRPTIVSDQPAAEAQDHADTSADLPEVNIDAIVATSAAEAEARGLNSLEMPETSEPETRPIHRRPVPFSVANQPAWIGSGSSGI
jgi:hypothetical protein